MRGLSSRFGMKSVMILGGLLPAAGVLVAHFVAPHSYWEHEPFHAVLESLGSFVALSLAAIMLFLRKHRVEWAHSVWFSSALTGMGILNGFHAAVSPGASFVWLRSAAILVGGLLSALIWLPDRYAKSSQVKALPGAVIFASVISGILLIAFGDHLPAMVMDGVFTPIAMITNILGGFLFLVAALRFILRYRAGGGTDELLFAYLCLLFGLAGMVFQFSPKYWHLGWWLWHILQLAACFLALSYGVVIFSRVQNELTAMNESLRAEVAERKNIESALLQSETKYRTLVEQIPAITYTAALDETSTTTYISPQVESILGYTPDQYKADPDIWSKRLHPEEREHVLDEVVRSHATGEPFATEYRMLNRYGETVWFRDEAVIVRDDAGKPIFLQGVMFNVTARKEAEEALQNQVRFLETLMNTIPSPIFYKDTHGLYIGCNKAFEAFLGLSRNRIIGKSVYDLASMELADKYHEMDSTLYRQHGIQIYETAVSHADGSRHDVVFYKSTFLDSSDSVAGLVGVILDITERKRAEGVLQNAHDELEMRVRERTAELVRANEELHREIGERKRVEEALQQSSEKLKLFAYSVVHDLKSPTVATHGLTKLLRRQYGELLDERGRKYCEQILKASEHIAEFVEEINIFIASKEAPLAIETIRMNEIVRTIRNEFSARLDTRCVRWLEPGADFYIRGDKLCILRCMRNFVDNALKYGGEELREIRIDWKETDDCYILTVSDDGKGMRQEDSQTIFEPFRRHATSRGIQGTGLGLAIVKEIAERHDGTVWVEPAKHKGATFCISISKTL